MKNARQFFGECLLTSLFAVAMLLTLEHFCPSVEAQAPNLSKTMIYDGKGTAIQVAATGQLWDNTANAKAISNVQVAANVVTITTSATSNYAVGQRVVVAAVTNTQVNGTYVIASTPSGTTFTYALTTGNVNTADTGTTTASYLSPVPTATSQITLVFPTGAFALIIIPTVANDATFSYTASGGIGGTFPLYTGASNVIAGQEGDTVYIQRTTTTPLAFQFALGK